MLTATEVYATSYQSASDTTCSTSFPSYFSCKLLIPFPHYPIINCFTHQSVPLCAGRVYVLEHEQRDLHLADPAPQVRRHQARPGDTGHASSRGPAPPEDGQPIQTRCRCKRSLTSVFLP